VPIEEEEEPLGYVVWGCVVTSLVGSVALRRKPQSTCVQCEVLASLRHAHLVSFFLDREDVTNLNMGTIWSFGKGTGLPYPSINYGAQKASFKA